ncbi:hypothetical protein ABT112_26925 [Streptomyces sp. NPDC002055]|uniref:hypothetical protein n=1 Tax=Streptomyces sp. NPDC002055 TaxID=3154534 RepID=UPI00331DDC44
MSSHTPATSPPHVRGLQPPGHGVPSPALRARAQQGLARFLARTDDSRRPGRSDEQRPR